MPLLECCENSVGQCMVMGASDPTEGLKGSCGGGCHIRSHNGLHCLDRDRLPPPPSLTWRHQGAERGEGKPSQASREVVAFPRPSPQ